MPFQKLLVAEEAYGDGSCHSAEGSSWMDPATGAEEDRVRARLLSGAALRVLVVRPQGGA